MTKYCADKYQLFIDGKWVDAQDGKTFTAHNPANGEILASCADAGKQDVDKAVKAAWKAFDSWKKIGLQERAAILLKIADIIDANAEKLAMVETLDNGKPIRETMNVDVPLASDHFRYFAGAIRTEEGQATMINDNDLSIILREPIGVIGQIVPWNFPFLMAAWKLAPALAAGNCIVFKPSSTTSLSVLEFIKLIEGVLPAGVVNLITGKGSGAGNYMLEHEGFRKLAFTGSTDIGYTVADAAAKKLIPATLELGGKSPTSISPMPRGKKPSKACRWVFCSIRGRSAAPAPECLSMRTFTINLLPKQLKLLTRLRSACPGRRIRKWARLSTNTS